MTQEQQAKRLIEIADAAQAKWEQGYLPSEVELEIMGHVARARQASDLAHAKKIERAMRLFAENTKRAWTK